MYNNWASCANVRSARLIEIEQQLERYRLARLQQFDAKEATMSYSFWVSLQTRSRARDAN